MKPVLSRIRNATYALLRPIYRRSTLLQRWRQQLAHRKAVWLAKVKEGWHSTENLDALQALANRRFDAAALPGPGAFPDRWPDIDVSVVTYNSRAWVEQFVNSLLAQHYPLANLHLLITDNGSSDGTVDAMAAALEPHRDVFGSVSVIRQGNVGFGAGHDRGIREGSSAYCLVTNIDLEFCADSIQRVVAAALEDTEDQVASWELRQMPYDHPKHYDPVTLETNWSSHACILLRRSAYEAVGGYEPRIFMYAEDVELSYRFRSFGYVLKFVPRATVHHYTYKCAGEVKPMQFLGSTLGNLYLRLRYGKKPDRVAGLFLYCSLFALPAPFPGARRRLVGNGRRLLCNWRHFSKGRGPVQAHFPFRAFDYEMRREGAFLLVEPLSPAEAPLVSVVMRTYQGRGIFLNQAMQSIFNQTYPSIELIVVQDGGDSLQEQVMQAQERAPAGCTVRFLANPKLGRSAAGNAGLTAATGRYLMFLDDDDMVYADHIETLAGKLIRDNSLMAAYALATEVLTDVKSDGHYLETVFQTPGSFYQEWDHNVMLDHNFIPIQAIVFRNELFLERGGFDETLDQLEDWHLWLRYGYSNTFAYVPKTTSLFRSPANPDIRYERAMKLHAAYDEALARAKNAMQLIDAADLKN